MRHLHYSCALRAPLRATVAEPREVKREPAVKPYHQSVLVSSSPRAAAPPLSTRLSCPILFRLLAPPRPRCPPAPLCRRFTSAPCPHLHSTLEELVVKEQLGRRRIDKLGSLQGDADESPEVLQGCIMEEGGGAEYPELGIHQPGRRTS